MSEIILRKYHGVGNDYLIFDPKKNDVVLNERLIRQLCRRNIGVGADGILDGPVMEDKKIKVRIFNPDGSEAEKSGNGIRIFSRYLKDAGYVKERQYYLTTKAGETLVTFLDDAGSCMRVDMGYAVFEAEQIPALGFEGEVVGESIFFCDNFYNATCVSMGNPHAIVYLDKNVDLKAFELEKIGPMFENHPAFPDRVNTEFIQVCDSENLNMRVWERGSGETFACGTGACASLVATVLNGLCNDTATLHLLGGDLKITWDKKENTVYMEGPAETVFTGEWLLKEEN